MRTLRLLSIFLAVATFLGGSLVSAANPGDDAPGFALPDSSGREVVLDKLRGSVVYVDFWASWCGPCKRSFPWMNEMARKYASQGLTIVAINVDKKREDAQKFLSAAAPEFTVVYDPAGRSPASYQVKAMPSSYLVDANGKVVLVESGFKDERKGSVEARIRATLGLR